ncbi:hypothetical protein [Nostoc sp.]|uniref:hypothetical protein n=1 Tax=Nostoc sp. TaxID=1180 RepID=UPI002FF61979
MEGGSQELEVTSAQLRSPTATGYAIALSLSETLSRVKARPGELAIAQLSSSCR